MNSVEERIIWIERLASACKGHGYATQVAQLRAIADGLNRGLPPAAPSIRRMSVA